MKALPLDRALRAWLLSDGSLSRRLAQTFGGFRVQLLGQGTAPATAEELRVLRRHGTGRCRLQRCHVREVVLWGDGQPLVHARSVLPAVQARLTWRAVRGLGHRPLADLLFGLRAAHCDRLGGQSTAPLLARRLAHRLGWSTHPLWCRRSVFTRRGVPLLVTEWFAPATRDRAPGTCTMRGQPRRVGRR
ncbi:MAG: chorismate--pyruvate lyase [Burkholderiales bacterium PBB1]|nr:MAG: chorismate--pyruvate lyase [Burkholderiales bacterium PBB1]